MKSILHLKFIVLYIIFGFLCVFTTAMLAEELIQTQLEDDTSQTLYREATLIASDYLPSYFTDSSSVQSVQAQLAAMVGVSRNTISSIETGQFNPTAKLALILCIALDRKFEDLFYFDEK